MKGLYTTKGGGTIKDIDVKTGTITGYAASFDTVDSDGDVFQKGAFKKSLNENKSRIIHLLQHDTHKPIGRPDVLREDLKGLYFEEKISKELMQVSYIKDMMILYNEGVYKEHSVGFQTIADKAGKLEDKSVNLITEVKLWEFSTVTWGANENTPFEGFKSLTKVDTLEKIDRICKGLRVGGLTDETYINLEIELQQIKTLVNGLLPSKDTKGHNEPSSTLQFLKGVNI